MHGFSVVFERIVTSYSVAEARSRYFDSGAVLCRVFELNLVLGEPRNLHSSQVFTEWDTPGGETSVDTTPFHDIIF